MARPLVPDDLWAAVEPLLPPARPRSRGCRPPISDRAALTVADIGRADYCAPMIASFRVLLPKVRAMSQAEVDAFVDGLERASAENRFLGANNFYAYVAWRGA